MSYRNLLFIKCLVIYAIFRFKKRQSNYQANVVVPVTIIPNDVSIGSVPQIPYVKTNSNRSPHEAIKTITHYQIKDASKS